MLRTFAIGAISLALALSAGAAPVSAQTSSANSMLAEALQLIRQASRAASPDVAEELRYRATVSLEMIVDRFPQSAPSAQIQSGDIYGLDLTDVLDSAALWAENNPDVAATIRQEMTGIPAPDPVEDVREPETTPTADDPGATPNAGRPDEADPVNVAVVPPMPEPPAPPATQMMHSQDLVDLIQENSILIVVLDGNEQAVSTGTGFFITRDHVLTNAHVTAGGSFFIGLNMRLGVTELELTDEGDPRNEVAPDLSVLRSLDVQAENPLVFAQDILVGSTGWTAGFPGKMIEEDLAYIRLLSSLASQIKPGPDAVPTHHISHGNVERIYTHAEFRREIVHVGVSSGRGASGSAIVNECGEVIAQLHRGSISELQIDQENRGFIVDQGSIVETNSFREILHYLDFVRVPYVQSQTLCRE